MGNVRPLGNVLVLMEGDFRFWRAALGVTEQEASSLHEEAGVR
ncbi:MAG: hypothetical protein ACFWT5_14305 [Pseudomonas helleri]|jgi:hypothetical protein